MRSVAHLFRCSLSIGLVLCVSAFAIAQSITFKAKPARVLSGVGEAIQVDDVWVLPENTEPKITNATEVCFGGIDDCKTAMIAEKRNRDSVLVRKTAPATYLVMTSEEVFLILTVSGEDRFEMARFVLNENAQPEPKPDDDAPIPPGPDPPAPNVDVENTFGLGKIAYELAPRDDPKTINSYQKMYFQAAEFLYGRPTAKAVYLSNAADQANPDRSVMAWITQQYSQTVCTDQDICEQWAKWREALHKRANALQRERQMTRADWYQAFREISAALEAVQ